MKRPLDPDDDRHKRIDFMYEVMRRKLDLIQNNRTLALAKTSFLIAFTGTVLFFYLSYLLSDQRQVLNPNNGILVYVRYFVPTLFIASIISLLVGSLNKTYHDHPSLDVIYSDESFKQDSYALKQRAVAYMREGYIFNSKQYDKGTIWFTISIWTLILGIILGLLTILFP